jgi:hypothetical protein
MRSPRPDESGLAMTSGADIAGTFARKHYSSLVQLSLGGPERLAVCVECGGEPPL